MSGLSVKIRNRLRLKYVCTDFISTSAAMLVYNAIRCHNLDWLPSLAEFYRLTPVWSGQILFPLMMMAIYWLSGYYNNVNSRSRAQELLTTLYSSVIGALLVFFLALINDIPQRRLPALEQILSLALLFFIFVYTGRYLITRLEVQLIHSHKKFDHTLMLGIDDAAVKLARRINSLPKGMGMKVTTLVRLNPDDKAADGAEGFNIIGFDEIQDLCNRQSVSNIILSPSLNDNRHEQTRLLRTVFPLDVAVHIAPDMSNLSLAAHRTFNVVGEPLVCISSANITDSTANIKRLFDVILSLTAMTVLSPVFAAIAIAVKLDDGGPVIFRQERMGFRNRPFQILKFRTMRPGSDNGQKPSLTSDSDPRITRVGHFLRKYRLDEIPQFLNVLKGEMSLVGPRPERRFFAEQIAARIPYYHMIYQVRPGITSWGMVRYGYASDVDQMIERLRYDLIYLENISISTDLKILLHTVNTIISGKGK